MTTLELSVCTLTFIEEDIAHAHFRDGLTAGADEVDELFGAIRQVRGGRKTLLVVSFGDGAGMNNEARAQASGFGEALAVGAGLAGGEVATRDDAALRVVELEPRGRGLGERVRDAQVRAW